MKSQIAPEFRTLKDSEEVKWWKVLETLREFQVYQSKRKQRTDMQSIAGKGESDSIRALAFGSKATSLAKQFTKDLPTFLYYSAYSNS